MSMHDLKKYLDVAKKENRAIGHFNISNVETLWAIFDAARALAQPVIIGVSEGERNFIGVRQAASLVQSLRNEFDYPIFMNADHTHDVVGVLKAMDAGFDSVMIDGSQLAFDDNVAMTKECVEHAHTIQKHEHRTILVEAELGFIGTSSAILDAIPEGAGGDMTDPDVARQFVEATGVDIFAPSVGNIHGIVTSGNPHIDADRVAAIAQAVDCHLVLHGGSGINDDDMRAGIAAGMSIVHVNTEIRAAFRKGLEEGLKESDTVAPYKYMDRARKSVYDVVYGKIQLFAGIS
jgi:fructose-bisphosphate aldolase class II